MLCMCIAFCIQVLTAVWLVWLACSGESMEECVRWTRWEFRLLGSCVASLALASN